MEEKAKDINVIFTPQIGLGDILFSSSKEEDVIKILGSSVDRSIDIFNDEEYAIYLDYYNLNISVNFYFENNELDRLSIHTNDLILDNFRFSSHNQDEILSFLKEYHRIHKLQFSKNVEYDKDMKETYYKYENIGLSIWFDEDGISDICVQKS